MGAGDPEGARPEGLRIDTGPWWTGLVRRKGHVSPMALAALATVGLLPLVLALARIIALPGSEALPLANFEPLRALGETLNQNFTLQWVPPSDRPSILYLLLLPTGALLVAFARLTLGVRVLGLRAILIAIGFQANGLLPSLALMAVVVGTIMIVRPWIRRARLPMYGRIAVVLTVSAMIMVAALMVAPWLGSEAMWRLAFFPVIIMAMLAEGVARSVEQDNKATAAWRAGWTILLALMIALIDNGASTLTYQFPELMLTQLVSIIFLAEFFDLRLLERWPDRLDRWLSGVRPWYQPKPRIALVRNRDASGVIGRLGRPASGSNLKQSVQRHVDALREQGFRVRVIEGDIGMIKELERFLPPDPRHGTPGGIVLNLANGLQGEGRHGHVPAMLEMAGIPYTGPDPLAHAHLSDRFALMALLSRANLAVPRHQLLSDPNADFDVQFPCAARPRFEPDANRIIVRNESSLRAAIREFQRGYGQPTVIEEIVDGQEIRVSVLGNDPLECLPLLEYVRGAGGKTCPAPLADDVAARVRHCAQAAFKAARCRDYARIDVRLNQFGEPVVVNVHWTDLFAKRGSMMVSASARGMTFADLLRRIVDEAARRYVMRSGDTEAPSPPKVVSLDERRAAAG